MKDDGCFRFKNGVFDKYEWTAGVYDTPERILRTFKSLNVCGKKIVSINAIGTSSLDEDVISSTARQIQYEAGVPHEIIVNNQYEYMDQLLIPCEIAICEPVVLAFEDRSTFEVQPVEKFSLKMGTNQIPREITDGINRSDFDANIVFCDLLGSSLRQLTVQTIYTESVNTISTYKKERFRRYLFWTQGKFGFSITQRDGKCYDLELRNQQRTTLDGIELVKKPYKDIQKSLKPVRQIIIEEGHDYGSCFWIMPVKQLSSWNEGNYGVEEFEEEEISIEEDDVLEFLGCFLGKYFDEEFKYISRASYYEGVFGDHLEHNIYTYDTVRAMIAEIRSVAEMLRNDFDNPALTELKSCFCPFRFSRDKNTDKDIEAIHDMNLQEKNELFRANIGMVIDFYERFCRRMEAMMEHAPQYDQISFMGP